jgi:hypothetical protein
MSVEKIQESLAKAQAIRDNVLPVMREFILDKYREHISKINSDRNLSEEGKHFQRTKLKNKTEVQFMKDTNEMQRDHDTAVIEARNAAERLLAQPLPQPSVVEKTLFNNNMEQIKAAVMFARSQKTALEALQRLVEIEQPELAKQAAVQLLQLSGGVVSSGTFEDQATAKKALFIRSYSRKHSQRGQTKQFKP